MDALQQNVAGVNISNVAGNRFSAEHRVSWLCRLARLGHAAGTGGLPERGAHQRSIRRHRQLGPDPDLSDQVDRGRDEQSGLRPQCARRRRRGPDERRLQLSRRRNRHDGQAPSAAPRLRCNGASRSATGLSIRALEGVHDNGYRNFSPSDVRRFYGDIGYRNDGSEIHLNVGAAQNNFGATAAVPVELLQQYWGATYTTPQTSPNQVGYLNLTGKFEVTPSWTVDGVAHYRAFTQQTQDGNPTGAQPCSRPDACSASATRRRRQTDSTGSSFPTRSRRTRSSAKIDRTFTRHEHRRRLPAGDQHRPAVRSRQSLCRRHELRRQRHAFRRERRAWHDRQQLCRQRQRHLPRQVRQSGFRRAGGAPHHQSIYRAIRARHVRRHQGSLGHRRRPIQRRAHCLAGPTRRPAQRQRHL